MIKVTGMFEKVLDAAILFINVDKKSFDKLKTHITNSMFFSYARSQKYDHVTLSSIGDHLDKKDIQDLNKADIGIIVEINPPPIKEYTRLLNEDDTWFIHAVCETEILTFCIDKETEFIKARGYKNVG